MLVLQDKLSPAFATQAKCPALRLEEKALMGRQVCVCLFVFLCVCVLLAGEQSHDVPVSGENAELHQVPEHTQDLQQELLRGQRESQHQNCLPMSSTSAGCLGSTFNSSLL